MMPSATIQVTFRKGRPLAAYLRIQGSRAKVKQTKKITSSLLLDLDARGNAVGLEILAFDARTLGRINKVLVSLGYAALPERELAPLRAA